LDLEVQKREKDMSSLYNKQVSLFKFLPDKLLNNNGQDRKEEGVLAIICAMSVIPHSEPSLCKNLDIIMSSDQTAN
jgi:hypothetical protein